MKNFKFKQDTILVRHNDLYTDFNGLNEKQVFVKIGCIIEGRVCDNISWVRLFVPTQHGLVDFSCKRNLLEITNEYDTFGNIYELKIVNKVIPNKNEFCKCCERTTKGWTTSVNFYFDEIGEKYLCAVCGCVSLSKRLCSKAKISYIKFIENAGLGFIYNLKNGPIGHEDYRLITGIKYLKTDIFNEWTPKTRF